jgi:hypothetical protein
LAKDYGGLFCFQVIWLAQGLGVEIGLPFPDTGRTSALGRHLTA